MSVRMTALMPVETGWRARTLDGGQFALGFLLRGIAVAAVFLLADDAAPALGGHELDHLRYGPKLKLEVWTMGVETAW